MKHYYYYYFLHNHAVLLYLTFKKKYCFYVRHGLNKQVSAYKFVIGIERVLTSISMYHTGAKLDTKLFLVPHKASACSSTAKHSRCRE